MPQPQDLCTFFAPKYQVFQNGEWQRVDAPFEGRSDPPPWLSILGVKNVLNYNVPYQSAARSFWVLGSYDPVDTPESWEVKFRCFSGETQGTLFHPLKVYGTFEQEVGEEYLIYGDATWVHFEGCTHTPPTGGKPVAAYDAIRLSII